MKHVDKQAYQKMIHQQQEINRKRKEAYLGLSLHKKMTRTFKGIMSYPQRKILYEIGKRNGS